MAVHVLLFMISIVCLLSGISGSYKDIDNELMRKTRERVKGMFQHAYDSYLRYAYPLDELLPLTCNGTDTWGSFSLSLIDALDTLLVMGNTSEFRRAYNLVITKPSFDIDVNTSVFEANIRVVGGLLSAHLLSPMADVPLSPGWPCNGPLLNMAHSLALRLLPAFDTPTGLPYGTINLRYGVPPSETPITCVACCSSFLIEFGTLSRLTGDPIFEQTALKSVHAIWQRRSSIGLPGNHIDVITGQWTASDFSVGNYVDSYLEYLVKGGVLFGHGKLIDMFNGLLTSIDKYTNNNGWYIWVNKDNGKMTLPYFEALDAYWPGLLSLVGRVKQARLTNFNHFLVWKSLGTLPEILHIVNGVPTKGYEAYHLRPELAESVWYLYQSTGSDIMIRIGLSIVEAIDKISRVPCGFATVKNCLDHTLSDRMESYFLAETLKYLYLLFDPDNPFSLDPQTSFNVSERLSDGVGGAKQLFSGRVLRDGCSVGKSGYVFSTEAHPIDVGSLHCCKDRWKGRFHDDGGYHGDGYHDDGYHDDIGLTPNHGCPAKSFTSRLEVYSVIRDKN